jgi:HEPN superfamily RiboL-PSP-like protein
MLLFEEISEDIVWRNEQLLIAKTLPHIYNYSNSHKEFLIKYSIPTIYAVWEGFVQKAFQIYVRELNKLGLSKNDFCLNILTHSVDSTFPQLKEYPIEFDKRAKFIFRLDNYFDGDFRISSIIKTESNVELEMINKILHRFNLKPLPKHPYKQQLSDLLKYRNRISHGDNSLIISRDNIDDFKKRIDDFVLLVENLMQEVFQRISEGYNTDKSHLNKLVNQ